MYKYQQRHPLSETLYIMRLHNYLSLLCVQRPMAQLKAIKTIQLFSYCVGLE